MSASATDPRSEELLAVPEQPTPGGTRAEHVARVPRTAVATT